MSEKRITEQPSQHRHLEKMTTMELLERINQEDMKVPQAIRQALPQIEKLAEAIYRQLSSGGRLFYIGSGTSGRLGIVDASECPPTYGVPHGLVVGIIAGGDAAIRKAQEGAEDSFIHAWEDLKAHRINEKDIVVGISASGTTPYVLGGLKDCREHHIPTGSISCNPNSLASALADYPVEVITGPEFVTGSTRMKAGTAQKLVLNMLTTSAMIRLGRVQDNKMVDMQLSNNKLVDRAKRMVMELYDIDEDEAAGLVKKYGSVRKVLEAKPL